jgi:hypothetical protein
MTSPSHPDRFAETLANRAARLEGASHGASSPTAVDPDARVDLHLLRFAAERAIAERGTTKARAWIEGLDTPDLLAGSIQDGTARGLMARLEEAISLCRAVEATDVPDPTAENLDPLQSTVFTGKELRRKRDILIASKGVRVRFSRKTGIHVIDRERDMNEPNCIQFEDQADVGCLDGFAAADATRPRLFSPAFLSPEQLVHGRAEDRLVLVGRLGRGRDGFPCRLTLIGRKDEPGIRMIVRIENQSTDHRLRIRFVGVRDANFVSHRGTPGFCTVRHKGRAFLAATLVRACGRLRVGESYVATPGAQVQGVIEHTFGLGCEV